MEYIKDIKVDSSGIVCASVLDNNGNCKGEKRFSSFLACATQWNWVLKRELKNAHKWADERIATCQGQET